MKWKKMKNWKKNYKRNYNKSTWSSDGDSSWILKVPPWAKTHLWMYKLRFCCQVIFFSFPSCNYIYYCSCIIKIFNNNVYTCVIVYIARGNLAIKNEEYVYIHAYTCIHM